MWVAVVEWEEEKGEGGEGEEKKKVQVGLETEFEGTPALDFSCAAVSGFQAMRDSWSSRLPPVRDEAADRRWDGVCGGVGYC